MRRATSCACLEGMDAETPPPQSPPPRTPAPRPDHRRFDHQGFFALGLVFLVIAVAQIVNESTRAIGFSFVALGCAFLAIGAASRPSDEDDDDEANHDPLDEGDGDLVDDQPDTDGLAPDGTEPGRP